MNKTTKHRARRFSHLAFGLKTLVRLALFFAILSLATSQLLLAQTGAVLSNDASLSMPTYNGVVESRVEAVISPKVDGVITAITFVPGQLVKKGDLLFRLYSDLLSAKRDVAAAKLQEAEAKLKNANQILHRYERLAKTNAVSVVQYIDSQTTQEMAVASVAEARANLRAMELELGQTQIVSPIDGRMSRPSVKLGDFAEAKKGVRLATVRQLDPIHVAYLVPYREFEAQIKRIRQDNLPLSSLEVGLVLPTGKLYDQNGTVEFTDAEFDKQQGLMKVWSTFPNPDLLLRPGLSVRIFNRP